MLPLVNATSVKMFPASFFAPGARGGGFETGMSFVPVSLDETRARVAEVGGVESYIGHADTAAILGSLLGVAVEHRRASYTVPDDGQPHTILLADYDGPRLPEGATTLPGGAAMRFFVVSVGKFWMN